MQTKKKVLIFLSVLALLLSSCGASQDAQPSPQDIARSVRAGQSELPEMRSLQPGDRAYTDYLKTVYGLETMPADGVVWYPTGVEASELAVLQFSTVRAASIAKETLREYLKERAGDFTGYAPTQAAIAAEGLVLTHGPYAALLICPDAAAAQSDFEACFRTGYVPPPAETEPPRETVVIPESPAPQESPAVSETVIPASPIPVPSPTALPSPVPTVIPSAQPSVTPSPVLTAVPSARPSATPSPVLTAVPSARPSATPSPKPAETAAPEPASDAYDHDAVLQAWENRDPAGLTPKNAEIFAAAVGVIGEVLRDNMSDYDKELAIHDWMIQWGQYDPGALSHAPDARPDPDNDNPYGFLMHGKGICTGYCGTFQLFMDMAGIECMTVHGLCYSRTEDHAWNLVRLDGEWYAVDVTWDDPVDVALLTQERGHVYFNVTSEYLRKTDHQWDEDAVPEATATTHAWSAHTPFEMQSPW